MTTDEAMLTEAGIYLAALDTWGAEAQTRMVFEEMAELQKALCKNARGWDNRNAIAEEIADVYIMLGQMELLHCCSEQVRVYKQEKLDRLQSRILAAITAKEKPSNG